MGRGRLRPMPASCVPHGEWLEWDLKTLTNNPMSIAMIDGRHIIGISSAHPGGSGEPWSSHHPVTTSLDLLPLPSSSFSFS